MASEQLLVLCTSWRKASFGRAGELARFPAHKNRTASALSDLGSQALA